MNNFVVGDWFANRAKLKIQVYVVENIEFELMALTKAFIEDVKSCLSYEEMVSFAADHGISYNRKRVIDNAELAKDIDLLWGLEKLEIDSDPCIKYRVGEKVCAISGLTETLEEMLQSEVSEKNAAELVEQGVIDGDRLEESDVTMGQLEEDATTYANHNNL